MIAIRGWLSPRPNAMASVNANPDDMRFHLWRRRVKDHWYHVRLFEGFNAHANARARGLKRLEAWLGDDHNLVLLRATILSAPARFGDERATAIVLGCVTSITQRFDSAR